MEITLNSTIAILIVAFVSLIGGILVDLIGGI